MGYRCIRMGEFLLRALAQANFDFLNATNATVVNPVNSSLTNSTNAWLTREEFEHFLGDPAVLHIFALVMGLIAILLSKRFPLILAAVASISAGLWVALIMQDRQNYHQTMAGQELPEGIWLPIVSGLLTTLSVAALTMLVWRLALAMLVGGLVMLIAISVCRLANVSPQKIVEIGTSALSTYRVVGAIVLVVAVLVSALLAKYFHEAMFSFASAHLGTLLLLSGISYFAQTAGGAEAPFSLLDDLARIFAEVRSGRCHLWAKTHTGEDSLKSCDCGETCQTEITAWLASSWTVLLVRVGVHYHIMRREKSRESEEIKTQRREEKAPLRDGVTAETIGAQA